MEDVHSEFCPSLWTFFIYRKKFFRLKYFSLRYEEKMK